MLNIDHYVLCSSQDHLKTGTRDLGHHVLIGAENTDSWHAQKGDLQRAFSLYVLMVPASVLIVTTSGERLLCDGFTLGETICFGSLEFIADYFSGLSLSPRRDGSDAVVVGSSRSEPPSRLRAMIGDSLEEFHTASDGEGGVDLPSPRWHGTGASPTPATTISCPENAPTTHAMVTIPLQQAAPWPDTDLPFKR
jgi:hypothetical protein